MISHGLEVNIVPDALDPTAWRVECINCTVDGSCEVAVFSGFEAKGRAMRYARSEYGYDISRS